MIDDATTWFSTGTAETAAWILRSVQNTLIVTVVIKVEASLLPAGATAKGLHELDVSQHDQKHTS